MEFITFAAIYVVAILAFVFIMLFGEQELFAGTPISWAHWVISSGMCQGIEWGISKAFGERGRSLLVSLEAGCCERSNPAVQGFFLLLMAGAFHLFWRDIFSMLPLPGIPEWHKYSGTAAVGVCLAFFLTASMADPGFVTPANLEAHCRLYPYDGQLFEEGAYCHTCELAKPARSKHCKACGRCVARFDHHCIWVNNCVGLLSVRWFLAFLLATSAVCAYGAVLGALCIRADMVWRDVWGYAYVDRQTGRLVSMTDSWRTAAEYIMAAYTTQVSLTFFLGIAAWIVFGFTAYQILRIMQGMTTNESFKWRKRQRGLALQREQERQRAKQDAITDSILSGGGIGSSGGGGGSVLNEGFQPGSKTLGASRSAAGRQRAQRAKQQQAVQQHNVYNRGACRNLLEVLFPYYHLAEAGRRKAE